MSLPCRKCLHVLGMTFVLVTVTSLVIIGLTLLGTAGMALAQKLKLPRAWGLTTPMISPSVTEEADGGLKAAAAAPTDDLWRGGAVTGTELLPTCAKGLGYSGR